MAKDYSLDPFFDLSPHLQCVTTHEGVVVRANPSFARITGIPVTDAEGHSLFELLGEGAEGMIRAKWKEASGADEGLHFSDRIRKPDGTTAKLDWHLAASNGFIYAAARDLTIREMAEERFRLVVNHAPNGIVVVDRGGGVILANPKAEELFGYGKGEMLGLRIDQLVPERFRSEHAGHRETFHGAPSARSMGAGRDLRALRKDGSEFPVEIGLTPIETEEGPVVLAVVVDITERRRLESELLEISEREQHRIGRDIHDDICQQLAGIGCIVSSVLDSGEEMEPDRQATLKEVAKLVADANVRARDLSHGLVTGGIESEGLAGALVSLAASSERMFNVSSRINCGEDADVAPQKMKVQLYRIAQEAISNAVRHGKATRVEVSLAKQGNRLELKVTDNGAGFDQSEERQGGIGLISMSRRARMMGGQLAVEGEPGKGTVVTCSVPLEA